MTGDYAVVILLHSIFMLVLWWRLEYLYKQWSQLDLRLKMERDTIERYVSPNGKRVLSD